DWYLRYHLKSVRGVADVASVGGYVRQYQVNIDPNRLRARGIPLAKVVEAVRGGNDEAGGRLIEVSGTEYMVRGRGYAKSVEDFENIVLSAAPPAPPIRIKGLGHAGVRPHRRRLAGQGQATGGGRAPTSAAAPPISTAAAKRFRASSSCATVRTRS